MSMRTLEAAILAEAKVILQNPKLRQKDILEWNTGTIKPQKGETVVRVPTGADVAVKTEMDKRKK